MVEILVAERPGGEDTMPPPVPATSWWLVVPATTRNGINFFEHTGNSTQGIKNTI